MPAKNRCNGFNVPNTIEQSFMRFFNYLYSMIKEAAPALLERDDVRKAYNQIVECCLKYQGDIGSYIPHKRIKYHNTFILMPYDYPKMSRSDDSNDMISDVEEDNSDNTEVNDNFVVDEDDSIIDGTSIPLIYLFDFNTTKDVIKAMEIRLDITKNYIPLYELIKRDVIPYMDRKEWEREKKYVLPRLNKKILSYNNRIKNLENDLVIARDLIQLTIQQIKLYDEPIITKFK
jgi:hypothetical protein